MLKDNQQHIVIVKTLYILNIATSVAAARLEKCVLRVPRAPILLKVVSVEYSLCHNVQYSIYYDVIDDSIFYPVYHQYTNIYKTVRNE